MSRKNKFLSLLKSITFRQIIEIKLAIDLFYNFLKNLFVLNAFDLGFFIILKTRMSFKNLCTDSHIFNIFLKNLTCFLLICQAGFYKEQLVSINSQFFSR